MPILYESYTKPPTRQRFQEKEKRYETGLPPSLTIDFWGSRASAEKDVEVRWDERYTTLHQALLYATAHGNVPFPSPAIQARWYVNDHAVASRMWTGPESCKTKTVETNIGAHLINGWNTFKIEIVKGVHLPGTPGIDGHKCYFVAQYTGEPPIVKPKPTPEEQLMTYIKYGAIATIAIGGLYIGGRAIAEWRRRKT